MARAAKARRNRPSLLALVQAGGLLQVAAEFQHGLVGGLDGAVGLLRMVLGARAVAVAGRGFPRTVTLEFN